MTSLRWYLLGLLALFGGYVALEYYRPQPLDWSPTLSNKDKIPFGTYALFDVLPTLLGTSEVASVRLPIYNQFYGTNEAEPADSAPTPETTGRADTTATAPPPDSAERADSTASAATVPLAAASAARRPSTAYSPPAAASARADTLATTAEPEAAADPAGEPQASYLFVNESFVATELENKALTQFVAAGNDVFIAASRFAPPPSLRRPPSLLATLGIELRRVEARYPANGRPTAADSVQVRFRDPALGGAALRLPAPRGYPYFAAPPGQLLEVLAADGQGRAVLVRRAYGRGHFYVCGTPLAFSNYYVLRPATRRFALAALSYLPTGRPVWWDEYQKQGRVGEQSVLRVVMGSPALRAAYYLLLATALLFGLVEARRRQRIIPTIKPLPNTTLLFTRTVAGLYRQGRSHGQIAEKKVGLFLDYLRTRFQEPAPDLADEGFRARLSEKAGLPRARVEELVRYINFARTAPAITDRELLILSRAIQDFKRESR